MSGKGRKGWRWPRLIYRLHATTQNTFMWRIYIACTLPTHRHTAYTYTLIYLYLYLYTYTNIHLYTIYTHTACTLPTHRDTPYIYVCVEVQLYFTVILWSSIHQNTAFVLHVICEIAMQCNSIDCRGDRFDRIEKSRVTRSCPHYFVSCTPIQLTLFCFLHSYTDIAICT